MTTRGDPRRAELERLLPLPPGSSLDTLLLYHPVFLELPGQLRPGESVLAWCLSKLEQSTGPRARESWLVACTEGRLLFLHKASAFTSFEIERRTITAIEEDPGWLFFSVKLTAVGSVTKLFQYGKPEMQRLLAVLRWG